MSDAAQAQTAIPAPFVSGVMKVRPEWIDYNGHLNMAYYNVLFDSGVDGLLEALGMGEDYVRQRKLSLFTAEVHLRYLRELHEGDCVRVSIQLLGIDGKRLHTFQMLHHATEGWLAATSENMYLHVDMTTKKTSPFPEEVAARLARLKAAHDKLPRPKEAGRSIGMAGPR